MNNFIRVKCIVKFALHLVYSFHGTYTHVLVSDLFCVLNWNERQVIELETNILFWIATRQQWFTVSFWVMPFFYPCSWLFLFPGLGRHFWNQLALLTLHQTPKQSGHKIILLPWLLINFFRMTDEGRVMDLVNLWVCTLACCTNCFALVYVSGFIYSLTNSSRLILPSQFNYCSFLCDTGRPTVVYLLGAVCCVINRMHF